MGGGTGGVGGGSIMGNATSAGTMGAGGSGATGTQTSAGSTGNGDPECPDVQPECSPGDSEATYRQCACGGTQQRTKTGNDDCTWTLGPWGPCEGSNANRAPTGLRSLRLRRHSHHSTNLYGVLHVGAAQQLRGGVREYSHESARHHHGHQHLDHRDRALGNECVLPRQRSQETASINDRTLTAHLVFRAALDCYQHAGLDESPSDLLDIVVVWVSAASLGTWTHNLNPLLHRRLEATFFPLGPGPTCVADLSKLTRQRLSALLVELEAELAQYSELRHLGHHLLDHADEEAQRLGCIWLTHFPDAETMTRVARVALDERRSLAVRDQAAWTLCFRQRQTRHPSLYFSPEAEATADAALRTLLDRGGLEALP